MKLVSLVSFLFIFSSLTFSQVQNPKKLDGRWKKDIATRSVNLLEFIALIDRYGFLP